MKNTNGAIRLFALLTLLAMLILSACSDGPRRGNNGNSDEDAGVDVGSDAEADADVEADSDVDNGEQVATGEPCPCQWGGGEGSGIPCAGCEGGRCWQGFNLSHPAYCNENCEENEDCEGYGEDWRCSFGRCVDDSRN